MTPLRSRPGQASLPCGLQYADEVDAYVRESFDILRNGNFWPFLRNACKKAFTKLNIIGAWVGAGLWPPNARKPLSRLRSGDIFTPLEQLHQTLNMQQPLELPQH